MGQTIIEKIIAHNSKADSVKPGDIVTVNVDRVMLDDIMIPFIVDKFHEMGFTKVWDPDKAVLIYDHLVPASQQDDTRHYRVGDAFVKECALTHVHRSDGICHQLMTEAGRRGFRHGQPYHDLRLCGSILYRNRVYGDGGNPGNRQSVGKGAGDDPGGD